LKTVSPFRDPPNKVLPLAPFSWFRPCVPFAQLLPFLLIHFFSFPEALEMAAPPPPDAKFAVVVGCTSRRPLIVCLVPRSGSLRSHRETFFPPLGPVIQQLIRYPGFSMMGLFLMGPLFNFFVSLGPFIPATPRFLPVRNFFLRRTSALMAGKKRSSSLERVNLSLLFFLLFL